MTASDGDLATILASPTPPRDKAAAAAQRLRESDAAADAVLSSISAFLPRAPRTGRDAAPFLALISAASEAGREELAQALGLVLRGHVAPLDPNGPAGRYLTRARIEDLTSREALRRVGAALGGAAREAARRRYARLHPYWRDDRVDGGVRALILNRLPNLLEAEAHFVHNQSNLPHAYAEVGLTDGLAFDVLFLVGVDIDAALDGITRPDVVYNNILSAEVLAAEGHGETMREIARRLDAPLINASEQHLPLTRVGNFERIGARERVFFPKTQRFAPGFDAAAATAEIDAAFAWPVIIRDLFGHMGARTTLAHGRDEAEAALRALADAGAYVIQHYDYPQSNGLYCRYRMFKIGEEVFASRIHYAEGWNVHGAEHDALKSSRPDLGLDALEEQFWEAPTTLVPPETWRALEDLLRETGADAVGCDFTLAPDGRALIFEVNGSMHVPFKGRAAFEKLCGFNRGVATRT